MISAEKLLDSLGSLPDDLIRETEALRRKKPVRWGKWAALAACLCLCIGLWFTIPGATKSDENAVGAAPENSSNDLSFDIGCGLTDVETSASSTGFADAIVFSVSEKHMIVTTDQITQQLPGMDGLSVMPTQYTLTFENLEEIPQFKPGQEIRIYYDTVDEEQKTIRPYKIEIIHDEEVQE